MQNGGVSLEKTHAVDIGAAPGGWTRFLSATQRYPTVTAVDPGELLPEVLELPGVKHLRKPAQEAASEIQMAELLVCDVNRDPRDTAKEMLLPLAEKLVPHAPLIFTLKLPKRMPEHGVAKWGNDVEDILGVEFEHFKLVWLFGNTHNERTLICFKKQLTL